MGLLLDPHRSQAYPRMFKARPWCADAVCRSGIFFGHKAPTASKGKVKVGR